MITIRFNIKEKLKIAFPLKKKKKKKQLIIIHVRSGRKYVQLIVCTDFVQFN